MYGRRLDHAAEEPADQRGDPLGGDDLAGRVVVAGRRGALGAVDPADDRGQGQRDRHRQVAERLAPVDREPGPPRRQRASAGPPGAQPTGRCALGPQARPAARAQMQSIVDQAARRPRPPAPRGSPRAAPSAPSGSPGSRASATNPATGCAAMSSSGRKLMITSAIAVSEPEQPGPRDDPADPAADSGAGQLEDARGQDHRDAQEPGVPRRRRRGRARGAVAARNAGPMIRKTAPKVLGVSSPSGIAVTSRRPVRRASRNAIAVKIRSPTSTPTAVPGIIRVSTNVAREPEAADQQAGHQDHVADVVEHQAEERVDVPAREQAGGALGGVRGVRLGRHAAQGRTPGWRTDGRRAELARRGPGIEARSPGEEGRSGRRYQSRDLESRDAGVFLGARRGQGSGLGSQVRGHDRARHLSPDPRDLIPPPPSAMTWRIAASSLGKSIGLVRWAREPGLAAPADVLLHAEAGQGDRRDGASARDGPPHQVQAAAVGQADVADDQVEASPRLGGVQAPRRRCRPSSTSCREAAEQPGHEPQRRRVVLDQQDAQATAAPGGSAPRRPRRARRGVGRLGQGLEATGRSPPGRGRRSRPTIGRRGPRRSPG